MNIVSKMEQEVEKWRTPVEKKEKSSRLKASWRLSTVKAEITSLYREESYISRRLREIRERMKELREEELRLEKLFATVRVVEKGKPREPELSDEEILEAMKELRRGE